MELPIHQVNVWGLGDGGVENSSYLVPPDGAAAEVRRRLNGALPGKDAVLVVCCMIAGVSGGDAICVGCNSSAV